MFNHLSRRDFLKSATLTGIGMAGGVYEGKWGSPVAPSPAELYFLSKDLLHTWASALLDLQVRDRSKEDDYGGILSPANNRVHGRVGDAIYPFYHLAHQTNDNRYTDAALLLYRWMERRVSQPDGSWLNEPQKGSWKGTTVFSAIALAETLKHHGAIMDTTLQKDMEGRLQKAGEYIYTTFSIDYGNINYPITAAYGLSLLGEVLDIPKFREKGKLFAHQALKFITPGDGFLYGEGDPYYTPSPKGCFPVDLGYNVEESLPALVLYGLMNKDEEVLHAVTRSLQTHMEFMLPDGGWDNSWGTRNYKWTYWGSRTSDGCQPAYALMAGRDPRFYQVALRNTQLLKNCTKDGLLYGGPQVASHGIAPSVHHTFCHIKALTTILDKGDLNQRQETSPTLLPREKIYGSRFFKDIQTWLVSVGRFRATVTGYDREYKKTTNGHATGGALTLLWHERTGPLLCASMNDYQLYEADNMQPDTDPLSMPLTPRIELKLDGVSYMNISDLASTIDTVDKDDGVTVTTLSRLVDKNQRSPSSGEIHCRVSYSFTPDMVVLQFEHDKSPHDGSIRIIVPIISKSGERLSIRSDRSIELKKEKAVVKIGADCRMVPLIDKDRRIFNFVPGLEAIPFAIAGNKARLEVMVTG